MSENILTIKNKYGNVIEISSQIRSDIKSYLKERLGLTFQSMEYDGITTAWLNDDYLTVFNQFID